MVKAAGLFQAFTRNMAYGVKALIDQRIEGGEALVEPEPEPEAARRRGRPTPEPPRPPRPRPRPRLRPRKRPSREAPKHRASTEKVEE